MDNNKKWMQTGKIGCSFAALFARNPERINWVTIENPERFEIPKGCAILSLQFPGKTIAEVKTWACNNGFYLEDLGEGNTGLRIAIAGKISWVQYFGPDSHVKTRPAPVPELCMAVKVPVEYYAKVGLKAVLHLAHASVKGLTQLMQDKLWNSSFVNTERRLGHKPTLNEAAKTTFNDAK